MSLEPASSRLAAEPDPPAEVGAYRIGARIGGGGMGRVHEATHAATGRQVAIKLVREGASERSCTRLLREARAARAAAGEHVVEVLDAGLGDDGLPFVVMERLDGDDLGAVLRREGRLELSTALRIADQLLRGLERVHAAGVVHRDLKPENLVLLGCRDDSLPDAEVALKIVDFGVSKVRTHGVLVPGSLTREGIVLGTPLYMSPEQAQGLPDVDERSDLWSTGAILYQCLAGRAPHAGATYEQIVVAVCATDAPDVRTWNPAVPEAIARVLARALARDRRRRFRDAASLREALERAAAGELDAADHDVATVHADDAPLDPPGSAPTAPLALVRPRRRRGRTTQVAVGVASLVAGGVMALLALRALGLDRPPAGDEQVAARELPAAGAPPAGLAAAPGDDPAPAPPAEERSTARPAAPAADTATPAPEDTSAPRAASLPRPAPSTRSAPRRGVAAGLELRER